MNSQNNLKKHFRHSRGVALVTTLLLLSLFTVMTLAMVIATTSDTLINGYYRNFRGSFYAADSGVNVARQYLMNQFSSSVSPTYSAYSGPPIATGTEVTILSNLLNTSSGFGAYHSVIGSQTSWPANFKIDSANTTLGAPTCTVNYTGSATPLPTCTSAGSSSDAVIYYSYSYPYTITAIGQSSANQQETIKEQGSINVTVNLTNSYNSSFAAWGTLFDQYAICGSPFVKGTMSGKFFSNQSWNFGDNGLVGNGSYIFTGPVGAVNPNVGYMYSDGTCNQSAAISNTHSGTTISPTFQGGLSVGQKPVPLPTDSFNQERAVLNGIGGCAVSPCPAVTPLEMNTDHLTNISGAVWPATGTQPTTGVYIPYTTQAGGACPCTFTGGGIYVQGNADQVTLAATTSSVASGSHPQQVFTIKQGSTTTSVTLDLTAQTTTITSGATSRTITGLPENVTAGTEAAMLYVNGAISGTSGSTTTGLSGPSSGAAIQNGSAVTVTSTGTIAITGNITYSTEPVTLTQVGSIPADTLITSPSTPTNVLGIYTPGGDIQLQPTTNGNNLEIDASLAMVSSGGSGGLIAQWNSINTLTIVGGRIANQAKSGASLSSRNIWFDQRFAGNFAPPWFPSTTVTTTPTSATPVVTANRVSWVNTTAQ